MGGDKGVKRDEKKRGEGERKRGEGEGQGARVERGRGGALLLSLFLRSIFPPSIRQAPRLNGSEKRQRAEGSEGQGRGQRGARQRAARHKPTGRA